jgi:cbb3-type cytochrome oxidase maturation protein
MGVVYIMILVSLLIALLFFFLFIASVKSGQYDDTYTPSVRMLFDDEIVVEKKSEKSKSIN